MADALAKYCREENQLISEKTFMEIMETHFSDTNEDHNT